MPEWSDHSFLYQQPLLLQQIVPMLAAMLINYYLFYHSLLSYNLIDKKSRQIFINKDVLLDVNKKQIIENVIKEALVETNQASKMDHVRILNDSSLLVTSDDWSYEIQ